MDEIKADEIINLLNQAIQTNDMQFVKLAYAKLEASKKSKRIRDVDIQDFTVSRETTRQADDGKQYTKKEAMDTTKNSFNLFEDDGKLHVKDKIIDKQLRSKTPFQKQPPRPSNIVKIKCTECDKSFVVNKTAIKDSVYVCDECVTKKIKRLKR